MNHDSELKLQAYLDQELDSKEATEVTRWLANDAQAQALFEELKSTVRLLRENEPEFKLPESPEFYWSKIERAIQAENTIGRSRPSGSNLRFWLLRLAAPIAGGALILGLLPSLLISPNRVETYIQEMESPLENSVAFSFHSPQAKMTVVWIGNFK
jgi:anti-sigma factor RsiW